MGIFAGVEIVSLIARVIATSFVLLHNAFKNDSGPVDEFAT